VICELLRLGLSLQQIQQLTHNLREFDVELYESEAYLLTDGYSIYYAFNDGQVVDVHKNHRQMLLLVPLHEQVAKLQEVAGMVSAALHVSPVTNINEAGVPDGPIDYSVPYRPRAARKDTLASFRFL
jgi:hypothetical protein